MTDLDTDEPVMLPFSQAARRWAEIDELDVALHDIVYSCCRLLPCHSAAIAVTSTVPVGLPVQVRAASDPDQFAILLDIVGQVAGSPGVLAAATMGVVRCPDLTTESRPELARFASLTVDRTDIRATVAVALKLRGRLVGVLNLYFASPDHLLERVDQRAMAIADLAAIVIGSRQVERRAENLETALENSRTIGAAIGILVERHRITREEAFEQLRNASQRHNRKLSLVADDLVATGVMPH